MAVGFGKPAAAGGGLFFIGVLTYSFGNRRDLSVLFRTFGVAMTLPVVGSFTGAHAFRFCIHPAFPYLCTIWQLSD